MTRPSVWLSAALVLASATGTRAQPDPGPKDGKVTIPLTLSPMPSIKPLSRVMLIPQYGELKPGNRVQGFLKCHMATQSFFTPEASDLRHKWLDLTLDRLPVEDVRKAGLLCGLAYDPPYGRPLTDLDQAVRYKSIDWQEWFDARRDGINWLLPELEHVREMAVMLAVRMRAEIKAGDFPRAVESAKTFLGVTEMLGRHPTAIGQLVGIGVTQIGLGCVQEMIEQPGCPNLYWALTDLPIPLVDLRLAIQGERLIGGVAFEPLMTARGAVPEQELQRTIIRIDAWDEGTRLRFALAAPNSATVGPAPVAPVPAPPEPPPPSRRYAVWAGDPRRLAAARTLLTDTGFPPDAIRAMPPLQLIVTADIRAGEVQRDEMYKWVNLPTPQATGFVTDTVRVERAEPDIAVSRVIASSVSKLKEAQTRTDQRVAYLRVIEAVRLHAYENGGHLPNTLDDIKLPLPPDPVTGKPFEYAVKDGVATLHGANAQPNRPDTNRYYELRLRK